MPLPVWVPGQVLAAADVNSYFVAQTVIKTVTTARSSNTTISADPALTLTLAAGALYKLDCMVYYSGGAGAAAGWLQWNWTAPAGGGFYSYLATYAAMGGSANTGYSSSVAGVQLNATVTVGPAYVSGTSTPWCLMMNGIANGGTGGSLTFNWAQAASTTTATSVLSNSYLVATRIAT